MQIDRVMDCFAAHYCQQNPNIFEERDTCFILSFSIIMLNTDLHSPNVTQKMTLQAFIHNNRGIDQVTHTSLLCARPPGHVHMFTCFTVSDPVNGSRACFTACCVPCVCACDVCDVM